MGLPMTLRGYLDGTGTIIDGSDRYEGIRYHITVSGVGGRLAGTGHVDMTTLADAMQVHQHDLILELEDGEPVNVVVVEVDLPGSRLQIRTSGDVPGF